MLACLLFTRYRERRKVGREMDSERVALCLSSCVCPDVCAGEEQQVHRLHQRLCAQYLHHGHHEQPGCPAGDNGAQHQGGEEALREAAAQPWTLRLLPTTRLTCISMGEERITKKSLCETSRAFFASSSLLGACRAHLVSCFLRWCTVIVLGGPRAPLERQCGRDAGFVCCYTRMKLGH